MSDIKRDERREAEGKLAKALMVAIKVHAGQVDKQGEPYLLHVLRVVEAVSSGRAKVLAALHDVVEDGEVGIDALEDDFGMFVANSIEVLTREPSETYAEYIEGIKDGHSSTWFAEIREVKIADLRDNLGRILALPPRNGFPDGPDAHKWRSLKARYEKALAILDPEHGRLTDG